MQGTKITATIETVCKKLGINYSSPNHSKLVELAKDAMILAEHYIKIKEIMADLQEIEDKHQIDNGLCKMLQEDLAELNKIDHHLIRMATKIARKNEE